jgi:hypothetical protein
MALLKILCLFLIAWFGPVVIVRACRKLAVTWLTFVLLAIGITGFVYLQFMM